MKKIISILLLAFLSLPLFACVNRQSSANWIKDEGLSCGLFQVTINQPWIVVGGKKYYLAISHKISDTRCQGYSRECWDMTDNFKVRFDAVCKSYGFGKSVTSRDWPFIFSERPKTVAYLNKNKTGKFAPILGSGSEKEAYLIVRSITCIEN